MTESLADLVRVEDLPQIRLNPKETPPDVHVRPVVGGAPEAVMTLEEVRKEWPMLRTAFLMAEELYQETNPGAAATSASVRPSTSCWMCRGATSIRGSSRSRWAGVKSDLRDVGIYYWRRQALDVLDTAIRGAGVGRRRGRADPRLARVARLGASATLPVDRHRRRRQALPHEQGALPHGPREALRGLPRRRQGRRPLLQERAASASRSPTTRATARGSTTRTSSSSRATRTAAR